MFAQFRSQYPQGRIQTEMLPKIDGLHAFRAIVSQGDAIMATATAVDSDLEIAEDRAVKRALAIAGIAFERDFDRDYGYAGQSPMLTQVSRETTTVNSLPSANFNSLDNLSDLNNSQSLTHTTHIIQSQPALEYTNKYGTTEYIPEAKLSYEPQETTSMKSSIPQIAPETVDLSDAISKIDVEMERLNWTKEQGRDYLVRTFDKRARAQLTNEELLRFLSYLKSLPTPHRKLDNDDFF